MKLEINKEWVDEAVQKAVDEIKQNFVPLSVIEDIKADIKRYELNCNFADDTDECVQCTTNIFGSIYQIIDKHIKGGEQ